MLVAPESTMPVAEVGTGRELGQVWGTTVYNSIV